MGLEVRTITTCEVSAFREAILTVFGIAPEDDPDGEARLRSLIDVSQAWAAFDGGRIVATAASYNLAIGIPGGTLPMAGLTVVTVRPTHRRRGLLRELIRLHLEDARSRGLAISGLWSSEAPIYGRFGYGIACECDVIEIEDARAITVGGRELDTLEWLEEPEAREQLPAIYARATAERPGALRRSDVWWRERRFLEGAFVRAGATKRRHVIARRGSDAVGYLVYRQRGGIPAGKVEIVELVAIDARAEATLWQFALAIDLFPSVSWWNAPTDEVLPWMVDDPRRIRRRRVDTLWLRIGDVAAALGARRFSADGSIVFSLGAETWELVVEGGAGRCAPTMGAAEVELDRASLGAIYLGGVPASRLARAQRIRGEPGALALADRMFSWPVTPWCPEMF